MNFTAKIASIGIIFLVLVVLGIIFIPHTFIEDQPLLNKNYPMQINSPSFQNSQPIPAKFTCDGENISPALRWDSVPENAQSLVLIVDDPDAPAGSWIHWTVFNIDPQTTGVAEDSVPGGGVAGVTGFGTNGYGGPCPPSGKHRYFFRIFALDKKLDLSPTADANALYAAMDGHLLSQGEFYGTYQR